MKNISQLYTDNLGTLTDLYQLTMAYGYWKNGMHEKNAVFHLFFRKEPFGGNYAICAGLEYIIHLLNRFSENGFFQKDDIDYLRSLTGYNEQPLFDKDFLNYLNRLKFTCTVDAIPEGTIVFAQEPLLRITGPIIQCQLLETALLNIVNFQTLIATKTSRICTAAKGDKVIEFGLRRAQGIDGGISASRAAYIGGCSATSNVLAGKLFGIPVIGTHAHSWVMSFESEEKAFEAYAEAMPNNCVFLVDTYDTIEGIKKAIQQGSKLKEKGHKMIGIRLDSGDLCELSIKARSLLDQAGFYDTVIIASNDLDEHKIDDLKYRGAKIDCWGVGTQLVTGANQPALGGVYKLGAIEEKPGIWMDKIKLSEDYQKVTLPGYLEVYRFRTDKGHFITDVITGRNGNPNTVTFDYIDFYEKWSVVGTSEKLLKPVFNNGNFVGEIESLETIRERVKEQYNFIPISLHTLPIKCVSLSQELFERRQKMRNISKKPNYKRGELSCSFAKVEAG